MGSSSIEPGETQGTWIDDFIDYTEGYPSAYIFRKWSAAACIAGAMERKLYVETFGKNYYAGMYSILLGNASTGKSFMVNLLRELWSDLKDYHVASPDMTSASMMDELFFAKRNVILPSQQVLEYNTLLIASSELGTLFKAYEAGFMSLLTDLWDGAPYSRTRKGEGSKQGEKINIPKPQIQFIAGCTPSWFGEFLPQGAWDQGFLARTVIVFTNEETLADPFADRPFDKQKYHNLLENLKVISQFHGKMYVSQEAKDYGSKFATTKDVLAPKHPKLQTYVGRRTVHLIKLSMVMAIARYSTDIELEDMRAAYHLMIEIEGHMEHLFNAINSGGTVQVMEEAYHTIWILYQKDGKPVSESILVQALVAKMPPFAIETTVKLMITTGMLKLIQEPGKPNQFVPLRRT
jgi:Protein of unknown function (DUF3987)